MLRYVPAVGPGVLSCYQNISADAPWFQRQPQWFSHVLPSWMLCSANSREIHFTSVGNILNGLQTSSLPLWDLTIGGLASFHGFMRKAALLGRVAASWGNCMLLKALCLVQRSSKATALPSEMQNPTSFSWCLRTVTTQHLGKSVFIKTSEGERKKKNSIWMLQLGYSLGKRAWLDKLLLGMSGV